MFKFDNGAPMNRRRLLGITVAAAALPFIGSVTPARVQAAPPRNQSFWALYQGDRVGTHSVSFLPDGEDLIVVSHIDITVKVLFFVAYRYSHDALEVWRAGLV